MTMTDTNIERIITGGELRNPGLSLLAETVNDLEEVRKATNNRLRALTASPDEDADGLIRGLGFTEEHPIVAQTLAIAESITAAEKQAIKNLEKAVAQTVFYPWLKSQKGLGAKQIGRLLAAVGDPYWNDLHERPRTVSELWAYCGYAVHDGSAQRRKKGEKSNWSAEAKMRAYNVAKSCIKQVANEEKGREAGHYRLVYEAAKAKALEAFHSSDCVRCGPSGKPALAGTQLSAGHADARALRIVSKEILKDLWIVARDHYAGA